MRIILGTALAVFLPWTALADDNENEFALHVQKEIDGLEKDYAEFQQKPPYQRVKTRKEIVRALLQSADTEEKRRILAERLCTSMAKSKQFQFYEYYILWLGRGTILQPAQDKKVLLSLVAKVNSRAALNLEEEVRLELCAFAIENLMAMLSYPGEREFVDLSKLEFDSENWKRFSEWLQDNYRAITFDVKTKRFRVPVVPEKKETPTNKEQRQCGLRPSPRWQLSICPTCINYP